MPEPGIPAYVGLPNTHSVGLVPGYHGAAYLGVGYNPFSADGDPNSDSYQVANLGLPPGVDGSRAAGRRGLLGAFDRARRDLDASGLMEGLDQFDREAFSILLGNEARRAFDLSQEDPRLRDRYGRHQWCQSALLARRLVQAGVRFVTLTFSGWDFHSSLESGMKRVLPLIDSAIGSLIEDLEDRGMLDSTMVMVMGEFGRTPAIEHDRRARRRSRARTRSLGQRDERAGRRRWSRSGPDHRRSNARGEIPRDRPVPPAGPAGDCLQSARNRPPDFIHEPRRPADHDRIRWRGYSRALRLKAGDSRG